MHGISDIVLDIGQAQVNLTIEITTLMVMAFLIVIAFFISGRLDKVTKNKIQNICEIVIEFLNKLAVDMIGPEGKKYVPLGGTIFLFVLISNWMGLLPGNLFSFISSLLPAEEVKFAFFNISFELHWHGFGLQPPTSNMNTPLALALITVCYYNYSGIRKLGLKNYVLHHIEPLPALIKTFEFPLSLLLPLLGLLFLFINLIEHISRAFSLTVRLFCNIMGEHSVLVALVAVMLEILRVKGISLLALPILFPIPLIVMGIGILTGAIQALIFTLLTFSYIGSMAGEHH